jgi:hypothetical protein
VVLDRGVVHDPDAIDRLVSVLRGLGGAVVIGLDVAGSFARFLEAVLLAEGFALVHTPGFAVNRAAQVLRVSDLLCTRLPGAPDMGTDSSYRVRTPWRVSTG